MKGNLKDRVRNVLVAFTLLFGASGHVFAQGLPGPSAAPMIGQPAVAAPAPTSIPSSASGSAMSSLPSGSGSIDENYRLGTGDKLKVTVYGEDDLSGEVFVDGSGQVQLPLIGQIHAAGLNVHEFVRSLQDLLASKYLKDPKVNVQIENYRPFYIMGEVNKPGEYPYENGLNALGAVALAGGYTYRANDSEILIRRDGQLSEGRLPATTATKIGPGDVVRIPERFF